MSDDTATAVGSTVTSEERISSKRRWAITAGVMTGMFIAALEATVVGTAMPTVIASLGGLNHYSWVFSAYLVTSGNKRSVIYRSLRRTQASIASSS